MGRMGSCWGVKLKRSRLKGSRKLNRSRQTRGQDLAIERRRMLLLMLVLLMLLLLLLRMVLLLMMLMLLMQLLALQGQVVWLRCSSFLLRDSLPKEVSSTRLAIHGTGLRAPQLRTPKMCRVCRMLRKQSCR